ncbi:SUMF1/EgtB/PvdO family nonheme iron enzyme [uncultured Paraglaciecola sp.]|uniref:formylglycine-generating enzyme family protein n=1 Tax=uncultured Paraglaciecola sp. TaxID=1765024 RepID=UPI0026277457|nr:SUMF1/EgtB/PvdO family nonheme iron enzyme [uncultured Paraglaciecola sp.]
MSDWDDAVSMGFEDLHGNILVDDFEKESEVEQRKKVAIIVVDLTPSKYLSSEGKYLRAKLINNELNIAEIKLEVLQDKYNENDPLALEVFCNKTSIGLIQKYSNETNIDEYCFTDNDSKRGLHLKWEDNNFLLIVDITDSSTLPKGRLNYQPKNLEAVGIDNEDWVNIPSGDFEMALQDPDDELPEPIFVEVDAFQLLKTTVTFDMYDIYCDVNMIEKPDDEGWGRGKRPVINVTYWEALEYCTWLSTVTSSEIRLPTEAEWEYACRAGTTTLYYYGETADTSLMHVNKEYGKTKPVEQFPPNNWGLYDMHGNVSEWCASEWEKEYLGQEQRIASNDSKKSRILRGGSWECDYILNKDTPELAFNMMKFTTSAGRKNSEPDYVNDSMGFRLLREKS